MTPSKMNTAKNKKKTTLQFVSGFSVQQQLQQGTNVILVTCLFGLKTKNPVQSSAHRKSSESRNGVQSSDLIQSRSAAAAAACRGR